MKHSLAVLVVFFLLTGCQKVDLHHGLAETEAGEILNLLHENGISASKDREVSGQEVTWKVTVSPRDLAEARRLVIANNLPRSKELGLSGVYKEKGLIPTPDEQKARFLLALKGEIINSLEKIPGVVDADLVLNVPTENEFSDLRAEKKRPTASVVVRTRAGEEIPVTEGKIQRFVANSVPNLDPNDVVVIVSRAPGAAGSAGAAGVAGSLFVTPPLGGSPPQIPPPKAGTPSWVEMAGIRLDAKSIGRFKGYFIGLLALLVVVSAALLVNIVRLNRLRVRLQAGSPVDAVPLEGGPRPLLGGGVGPGGVEGTFEVGQREKR